jgi:uncharacterized protein YbjT (DUF2867 family)
MTAMDAPLIVVAGATGTVGGHVVRELKSLGVACAALVRDRARGERLLGAEIELREGDYERPHTLAAAFEGAERVFLVAPLAVELAELECKAIDAAVRAGVRHVVKLSTAGVAWASDGGAATPRQYPLHRAAEEHLERSGLAFTHLRPGPFMQNTLNFAPSIAAEGVFRGAWGAGALGYVDVRDVAAVAGRVLTGHGDHHRAYELTGPQALSPADLARKLSEALGREVRYEDVPSEGVRQAMLARGMSEWFAGAMVEVMDHTRTGAAAHVTSAVSELMGRPPRSYDDFAREFAGAFTAA